MMSSYAETTPHTGKRFNLVLSEEALADLESLTDYSRPSKKEIFNLALNLFKSAFREIRQG